MTTTHQLMAAAFYLCGLLFLLHVDSVNSLKCKYCLDTGKDCHSGNVPEVECRPNELCFFIRQFTPGVPGRDNTLRGCTSETEGFTCMNVSDSERACVLFCATDNCNNATNLGE
ncbi:uncharacterized protein LOC112568329 isoform X1 [Pomacea canaliculata]|uniref:uncharacterized protein LOC112568329 isoform X1 n=1 Tax=Pomacea canaliculata TaxID=400727 RepID=UPI000D731DD0|nr:uncharacterized protein LOC112568329 isoform X1 [Pomacea canaliculata]